MPRLVDTLSIVGALAFVLCLIVLLRYGTRFVAPRRFGDGQTQLRLIGQLGLDGKRRLHLVQCGAGQVLLLSGGATDVMLPWPQGAGPAT